MLTYSFSPVHFFILIGVIIIIVSFQLEGTSLVLLLRQGVLATNLLSLFVRE